MVQHLAINLLGLNQFAGPMVLGRLEQSRGQGSRGELLRVVRNGKQGIAILVRRPFTRPSAAPGRLTRTARRSAGPILPVEVQDCRSVAPRPDRLGSAEAPRPRRRRPIVDTVGRWDTTASSIPRSASASPGPAATCPKCSRPTRRPDAPSALPTESTKSSAETLAANSSMSTSGSPSAKSWISTPKSLRAASSSSLRLAVLQVDPVRAREGQQRLPVGQRRAAAAAFARPAAGTPRDADLQTRTQTGQTRPPTVDGRRVGREVTPPGREIGRRAAQKEGQAAGWNLKIVRLVNRRRRPITPPSVGVDRGLRIRPADELRHARFADEDAMPGLGHDFFIAAGKHHFVANSLLGVDQQGLSGQRRTVPAGALLAIEENLAGLFPPLISRPTAGEVAQEQIAMRKIPMRLRVVRLELQGSLVSGHCLGQPACRPIDVAEVVVRLVATRLQLDRPQREGEGLVVALRFLQQGAKIQRCFLDRGIKLCGAAIGLDGQIDLFGLEQRGPAVEPQDGPLGRGLRTLFPVGREPRPFGRGGEPAPPACAGPRRDQDRWRRSCDRYRPPRRSVPRRSVSLPGRKP